MESTKNKLTETNCMLVAARGWGVGETRDGGERVQSVSCKMNKFRGSNGQHGDCSQQYSLIYLKVAKRIDLKYSHHPK